MRATVPKKARIPATRGKRPSTRSQLFVFTLLEKARNKFSARVSPTAEQGKGKAGHRARGSSQMQKMSDNMDEVEDMETEMSPERM